MQARARATAGFSQNCRTARTGPVDRSSQALVGLDPAVLDLGRRRLGPQQHEPLRVLLHPPRHLGHVGHEGGLAQEEVIGREDRDDGLRVAPRDPVGRVEHPGRGAPVEGLRQDGRPGRRDGELLGDVARVLPDRGDQGARLRDGEPDAVQGLAEQAPGPEQPCVLLRTVFAEDLPHERAQTHALAPGEHDGPAVLPAGHADDVVALGSLSTGQKRRRLRHDVLLASAAAGWLCGGARREFKRRATG